MELPIRGSSFTREFDRVILFEALVIGDWRREIGYLILLLWLHQTFELILDDIILMEHLLVDGIEESLILDSNAGSRYHELIIHIKQGISLSGLCIHLRR